MPGSNPGWAAGYVPTATEWNNEFAGKQDYGTGGGAGEFLNVKDFGAVLDGVTDDTAAFNAARAAAANGQTIYVPNGKTLNVVFTPDTTKQVRWLFDGTTFPSGANIITWGPTNAGDTLESFLAYGTKYFGKRSNPAAATGLIRCDYILDASGGSNRAFLDSPVQVNSVVNDNVLNALWGICTIVDNNCSDPTQGGVVGLQSTVRKHAAAGVQAIQTVALDDTGLPSSANGGRGFSSVEFAQRANNIDDAGNGAMWGGIGNRIAMHVSHTIQNTANDIETSFSAGIWLGTDPASSTKVYVKSGIAAAMNYQTYQFIDSRGCIAPYVSSNPVASVRMLHEQVVDFNGGPALNSAPGNYLQYTTTGTPRLRYMAGASEVLGLDGAGNLTITGTLTSAGGGGSLVYTATGGTAARTAADRAADWINILDLGAIGDGVADDTAAFVAAASKPSGTTIFLPANKTFLITAQSYTFSNRCVSLIGGDRYSTIIRLKPGSPAMTAGLFFWNGPNRPGPVISNFTLDVNSNSASAYGQSLLGVSVPTLRPEISNVSVINMGSLCLAFGGTSWATGGEIRNCYVQQVVGDQVNQSKALSLSIFSTIPNAGVRILNNTFVNTNVLLTGAQKCLIEGNDISGWGVGAGVAIGWNVADTVSSFDNTIVNNKCHDSQPGQDTFGVTPNGLELWTDRGVIAGNHCWNNAGSGLLVGGKYGLVVGNIAYDNNVFNVAGQAGMVALYASATHNASFTTWIGNKSYDSGVGRQQYGFGTAGGVAGVTLTSNDFSGTTGQTNLVGATPVVNPFLDALFGRQMAASTGDTQGNMYIPFCNGVPTAVPAWSASGIALKYDTANHKLWAYDNSLNSWRGFDSTPVPDQLVLYRSGTAAGNGADLTLDVLQSYTLPANTLAAVGDILHIVAGGTVAASTDNKQIRVYFGSATAMQASATQAATTQWACEVWITKTGPSTQSSVTLTNVFSNFSNGTGGGTSIINDTVSQVIQVTGQNNTSAVAGSITCQFLSVELLR